jgi:acyl dehydratase
MQNYYYDTWIEDGTTHGGLREVGYRQTLSRPIKRFSSLAIGDQLTMIEQGPITRTQIAKYAGASYDFNPIHHDEEFAKRSLAGGIIAHGMMIMGYLGKCATAYLGTAQFQRFSSRNVAMTRPGDTLLITGRIVNKTLHGKGGTVDIEMTAHDKATQELRCTGKITVELE